MALSPRFSQSRDTAGVTSRECEMPSDISQYHNVAPSFPLNEILDLQLPSKNSFLLSLLSLAKEQLCNPCQITFCCSGMQEGMWDSCSLNYCSLKAACAPWELFRALAVATQGGWGCCPWGAPMSPLSPCPHCHRGILVMHWDFKSQNHVLCQNAYSQQCSAPFSLGSCTVVAADIQVLPQHFG